MRLFVLVLGLISSSVAWSHGGHAEQPGFAGGLLHPMTGIDHVLAAIGLGWWLSLQDFSRRSIPLYACALAAGLALAGLWTLMAAGVSAGLEPLLACTLILTGLLLWKLQRLPQPLVASVIAGIFSCHFYAHITEMPAAGPYVLGIFAGTVLMITGAAVTAGRGRSWTRFAGAMIAAAGATALGLA